MFDGDMIQEEHGHDSEMQTMATSDHPASSHHHSRNIILDNLQANEAGVADEADDDTPYDRPHRRETKRMSARGRIIRKDGSVALDLLGQSFFFFWSPAPSPVFGSAGRVNTALT